MTIEESSIRDFDEDYGEEYNAEKDRAEIIKTLVNALRIEKEEMLNLLTNSDLDPRHIPVIANGNALDEIGDHYNEADKYQSWILKFLEGRLSKGRLSRLEILEASRTMNEGLKSDEEREKRKLLKFFKS